MVDTGPSSARTMTWEAQYWNARYSQGNTSGYGSYGEQLERKLALLKAIPEGSVQSVMEIGCGDFNWGKHVMFQLKLPMEQYTGFDISEYIVTRNKKLYPKCTFETMIGFPEGKADLLMCVDVLLHIINDDEARAFVDKLHEVWTKGTFKYLVLTAYETPDPSIGGHVRVRAFDYKRFGEPIARDIVEQDGESRLYIYSHDTK